MRGSKAVLVLWLLLCQAVWLFWLVIVADGPLLPPEDYMVVQGIITSAMTLVFLGGIGAVALVRRLSR